MEKPATNDHPILDVLRDRWSPRAFDPDRPIERDKLLSLFEAARWAPSSRNAQPWRFIVATKDNPAAHERLLSVLKESNQRWAKNAPLLMLCLTKREVRGRENKNARHDLGQAIAHLTVQATALGLSLRQMGGILPDLARERYAIPNEYDVLNATAVGYAAPPETLPEDLQAKEHGPRDRQPLSAFVFGAWEQPATFLTEEPITE